MKHLVCISLFSTLVLSACGGSSTKDQAADPGSQVGNKLDRSGLQAKWAEVAAVIGNNSVRKFASQSQQQSGRSNQLSRLPSASAFKSLLPLQSWEVDDDQETDDIQAGASFFPAFDPEPIFDFDPESAQDCNAAFDWLANLYSEAKNQVDEISSAIAQPQQLELLGRGLELQDKSAADKDWAISYLLTSQQQEDENNYNNASFSFKSKGDENKTFLQMDSKVDSKVDFSMAGLFPQMGDDDFGGSKMGESIKGEMNLVGSETVLADIEAQSISFGMKIDVKGYAQMAISDEKTNIKQQQNVLGTLTILGGDQPGFSMTSDVVAVYEGDVEISFNMKYGLDAKLVAENRVEMEVAVAGSSSEGESLPSTKFSFAFERGKDGKCAIENPGFGTKVLTKPEI